MCVSLFGCLRWQLTPASPELVTKWAEAVRVAQKQQAHQSFDGHELIVIVPVLSMLGNTTRPRLLLSLQVMVVEMYSCPGPV